jgi:diaminohydroxyphosphoribosylaminopyrimidine deaminase/5-amino-6-(5-phosphoribosylamino)uracil reductase
VPTYRVLGEGWHRGSGTAHAEVDALASAAEAGNDVRGATAVVSLQPCSTTGRTGPCTRALVEAGIAEVVFAATDPLAEAAGSTATLEAAGVRVRPGLLEDEGTELLHPWLTSVALGRPYVTLKLATTLDGRVAATDGTSRWITGPEARAHAHAVRQTVGAIVVGTGTVTADDPSLTARTPDGTLADRQPLRVVVGERPVPDDARLRGPGGELVRVPTHDVARVLDELAARGVRHVLVEGGPTLTTAFLRSGLVDEVHAYLAPVALGAGVGAIGDLGVRTIADAVRWRTHRVERLGDDVLLVARRAADDAHQHGED